MFNVSAIGLINKTSDGNIFLQNKIVVIEKYFKTDGIVLVPVFKLFSALAR